MYSRIFIIRFLFIFLFMVMLFSSSLTKSQVKEGAVDSTPTDTSISNPTTSKTTVFIAPDGRRYKSYSDYYKEKNALYQNLNKDGTVSTNISNTPDKQYQDKITYKVSTATKDKNTPNDIYNITDESLNKYARDISQYMNVDYHKSENQLRKELEQPLEMTYIYDKKGNKILYPSPKVQGNITYHVPGSYPFGSTNYVPKYADSILLSKSTGLSTTTTLKNTAEMKGGFCSFYKNNPDKLEENCKNTDVNQCASTNCCTLLGGSNCVAGNENGPTNKAHYNDIYIRNKDYYYYQGKCYGNCT